MMTNSPSTKDNEEDKLSALIENLFIGIFEFIFKFIRTLIFSIIKPKDIINSLKDSNQKKYIRPFTFLVASVFIGSSSLQMDCFFCLTPEDEISNSIDLPNIPSITDAVLFSIPNLFIVVLLSILFSRLIFRYSFGLRNLGVRVICLGIGVQILLNWFYYFLLIAVTTIEFELLLPDDVLMYILLFIAAVIRFIPFFSLVPLLFYLSREDYSGKLFKKNIVALPLMVTMSITIMSSLLYTYYPTSLLETMENKISSPYIPYSAAESEAVSCRASKINGNIEIITVVDNSSNEDVYVSKNNITLTAIRTDGGPYIESKSTSKANIIDSQGNSPIIKFSANEKTWLHIQVSRLFYDEDERAKEKLEKLNTGEYLARMYYEFTYSVFEGTTDETQFLIWGNCNLVAE